MKTQNTKNLKSSQKLALCVAGDSGSGKTRLMSTFTGKIMCLNTDKGMLAVSGADIDFQTPENFNDVIDFMKDMKSGKFDKYDLVAIDSISACAELLDKFLQEKGIDGFEYWKEYARYLKGIIASMRDTDKFHTLSMFEIVDKEDANGILVHKFGVDGSTKDKIPYYYDEVLVALTKDTKDGTQYKLQTFKGKGYVAKDRSGNLEKYEEPNLDNIISKILG